MLDRRRRWRMPLSYDPFQHSQHINPMLFWCKTAVEDDGCLWPMTLFSIHNTITQCCFDVGPPSKTAGQQQSNTGPTSHVWCVLTPASLSLLLCLFSASRGVIPVAQWRGWDSGAVVPCKVGSRGLDPAAAYRFLKRRNIQSDLSFNEKRNNYCAGNASSCQSTDRLINQIINLSISQSIV